MGFGSLGGTELIIALVIILVLVLLLRPQGIFGRAE